METEIIDKLFLELSQFTTASTAEELRLVQALRRVRRGLNEGVSRTELLFIINSLELGDEE